jgi:hypothetical protein
VRKHTLREFSEGDRVQFTAPNREQHIANREMGTLDADEVLQDGKKEAFQKKATAT